MFETCVLGVDPGVARLGLAVLALGRHGPQLRWSATVRTAPGMPEAERLLVLASAVRRAIAEHGPGAVALEQVAWNRNRVSALAVARATGAVMAAAAEAGLPVRTYGPSEVKRAVAGAGDATKPQVARALVRVHGLRGVPAEPDAADAVAVALTHLVGAPLRGAVARAAAR
ncbi:MAG: hypothetical protein KatS3mg013_0314 [Actinomycetota bacterium]|jgi:crossover junction endodeoxyribonuclease RuvC|nr:MAG: hypothetical protein KatS3mg013_0314 [Actinomycetota bacterium]